VQEPKGKGEKGQKIKKTHEEDKEEEGYEKDPNGTGDLFEESPKKKGGVKHAMFFGGKKKQDTQNTRGKRYMPASGG